MQNLPDAKNEKINIEKEKIKLAFLEVEYLLISLHRMGSYYLDNGTMEDYYKETTLFVDESRICDRLAAIRAFLTTYLYSSCSEEEIEQFEDICENLPKWEKPGDYCKKRWLIGEDSFGNDTD